LETTLPPTRDDAAPILETHISPLRLWRRGKVRDVYDLGDKLLIVATDRISAFDVVLPTPIPDKGRVLTGLSRFWFEHTADVVPNHLLGTDPQALPSELLAEAGDDAGLRGRMMIGRHADVLPVECVVRGYLAGSGWKEYRATGEVCGIALPPGLRESDRLAAPIFTPATKAPAGAHDENIPFARVATLLTPELAARVRAASLALYARGAALCERVGIILADTKFEFGLLPDGDLILVDEVLTPDSSRFWDAASYEPGRPQASFDKQFVRDWLEAQPWDKTAPGPELPAAVVAGTRARYVEAFERITGASFARYLEEDVIAT
jgi:phosphoribosylaminoimidazole-succinocarboxamide synthase